MPPPPQDTNSARVQITRGSEKVWRLTVIVPVLKCSTCTESFIFEHWLHIWRCRAMMCTHHTNTKKFTSSQKVVNGVICRMTETRRNSNSQWKSWRGCPSFTPLTQSLTSWVTWKSWMNYVWPCDHSRHRPTVQWHCTSTQQTGVLPEDTTTKKQTKEKKNKEEEPSGWRDFLKHIFFGVMNVTGQKEKRGNGRMKKRVNESNELFT